MGVGVMLRRSNPDVAECRRRAAECAEHAKQAVDRELRLFYLDMEQRWMTIARSHEFSDSLADMSNEMYRRRSERE